MALASTWVSVEKYLTGRVFDIGGKQNPNVHVILSDSGNDLVVQATEQQLGGERENQLYKEVTLHVQAEQHLRTKALRNIRLIEFLPQTADVDEAVRLAASGMLELDEALEDPLALTRRDPGSAVADPEPQRVAPGG